MGISGGKPDHKDRRAARGQGTGSGIGCGTGGVAAAGVRAPGFADAAVAIARVDFTPGSSRQRPLDGAGIYLSDLSRDLNGAPRRQAGGLRRKHLDKSGGNREQIGGRRRRMPREVAMTWTCTWSRESRVGGVYKPFALMVPWPKAGIVLPPDDGPGDARGGAGDRLALSWLVVVVSMVAFSALITSAPGLEPAGAFTAPQPATREQQRCGDR